MLICFIGYFKEANGTFSIGLQLTYALYLIGATGLMLDMVKRSRKKWTPSRIKVQPAQDINKPTVIIEAIA